MDIGSGVAIAGGAFSIVAVVYRVLPSKGNSDYNKRLCEEKHVTIDKSFERIEKWMEVLDQKLDVALKERR